MSKMGVFVSIVTIKREIRGLHPPIEILIEKGAAKHDDSKIKFDSRHGLILKIIFSSMD